MMRTMSRRILAGAIACALVLAVFVPGVHGAGKSLPDKVSDKDFWQMVTDFSEPNGYFRSDNLLSNEPGFPYLIPELLKVAQPGKVYIGVGPEQNFNYIAALKPRMVFIVDIRRGNLDLQLLYKALFELSADRAEFVSRLFSKKRPDGLSRTSTAQEIFAAYLTAETSPELYAQNLKAVFDQLTGRHRFALGPEDRELLEYVFDNFRKFGPAIRYSSSQGGGGGNFQPSYAELMLSAPPEGEMLSYLSSEERFTVLKDLERKNLVVPVVGNFAGPKAIRSVGNYLTEHNGTVSAFYLSNVEQFLGGIYQTFCGNVATLPLDDSSTFIRSVRGGRYGPRYAGLNLEMGAMAAEVKECASSGR